jgi:hypothetical protein
MTKEWITYQVKESVRRIDPKAKVILFGSRLEGTVKKIPIGIFSY